MVSLPSLLAGLAQAYAVAQNVKPVIELVGKLMQTAEETFAGATGSGASKKQAVMDSAKAFMRALGVEVGPLLDMISGLIDDAKTFWNLIQARQAPSA